MKVLAIDSSPIKDNENIALLLDPLLDGMREAGAVVEHYHSRDLLILPCCGNLNCTVRTPGQCMARDDMRWLRAEIGQADILVLASPLYFNGRTGAAGVTEAMRRLLDRLVLFQGLSDRPYEHAVHTTREPVNLRTVVIVSGSGLLEIDGFYPALTHLKAFCCNSLPELAGCITGSYRAKLRGLPQDAPAAEIARAARATGRALVEDLSGMPVSITPATACDGGKESSGSRREWETVMLFELSVMH